MVPVKAKSNHYFDNWPIEGHGGSGLRHYREAGACGGGYANTENAATGAKSGLHAAPLAIPFAGASASLTSHPTNCTDHGQQDRAMAAPTDPDFLREDRS